MFIIINIVVIYFFCGCSMSRPLCVPTAKQRKIAETDMNYVCNEERSQVLLQDMV